MYKVFVTLAEGMTEIYRDDQNGLAVAKLLRRYRIWTRMLCAPAREVWPTIDWSELDGLA
jgi:hypothetical protein